MTTFRTTIQQFINTASTHVQQSQSTAADAETIVENTYDSLIDQILPTETLTPIEKTECLMVLAEEYGVNDVFITEQTNGGNTVEQNVHQMFTDAFRFTVMREIAKKAELNWDRHNAEDIVQYQFDSHKTPLETRLATMAQPESIIWLLAFETNRKLDEDQNDDDLHKAIYDTIEKYREPLWEGLDPAQQVHFLVQVDRTFDGAYTESAQWPNTTYGGWTSVITSGHLWFYIEGILTELTPKISNRNISVGSHINPNQVQRELNHSKWTKDMETQHHQLDEF